MRDLYIGLMSGTSMDAIDSALVDFSNAENLLLAHHSHPIPAALKASLLSLIEPGQNELALMMQADVEMGTLFAEAVNSLLNKAHTSPDEVLAIGSHGQTLHHYPGGPFASTLQIADANIIAEQTGITTVADFRRRDMAAGGQGAPLVPAFHASLFHNPEQDQVVLNIGGIANITLLHKSGQISGFDTGPGNCLMDSWIQTQLGQAYDRDGEWGGAGHVHPGLLERLEHDDYFTRPSPKSTGREYFNLSWLDGMLRSFPNLAAQDIQATLLELTARSICDAIEQALPSARQVMVCGGGVHNSRLMQRLAALLVNQQVVSTSHYQVDPDWMEAMAFAWLAKQTMENKPGNIPAVTGARHPVVLGAIYQGKSIEVN